MTQPSSIKEKESLNTKQSSLYHHLIEKPGKNPCLICWNDFPDSEDLTNHLESRHKFDLLCQYCNRKFNYQKDRDRHIRINHTCHWCDQVFKNPKDLLNHEREEHLTKKEKQERDLKMRITMEKQFIKSLGMNRKIITKSQSQEDQVITSGAIDLTRNENLSEEERIKRIRDHRESSLDR